MEAGFIEQRLSGSVGYLSKRRPVFKALRRCGDIDTRCLLHGVGKKTEEVFTSGISSKLATRVVQVRPIETGRVNCILRPFA